MTTWSVDVQRIRVHGAGVAGVSGFELRRAIERAVAAALVTAPLPPGRTVTLSLQLSAPSLAGTDAVAAAVATGVTRSLGGRARG